LNLSLRDFGRFIFLEVPKRPVLEEVSARLGLDIEASELAGEIVVRPVRDTQLIELSVESSDPQLAMDVANTLPEVFIERNTELQLGRFASSKENLSKQLTLIESDMETAQQAINDLQDSDSAADQAELARLQTLLAQHQSNYASLLSSYEGIRLAEIQSIDNIIVDEPAVLPRDPIRPRPLQNTLLAAVVGCMLAVGVAFLIEYLDDTIKTADDVKSAINLPTLGAVTRIEGAEVEDKLVTTGHPRSPASEAYRILRTNLQFSAVDKPLRTLLITSASPTEGKSLTAANLGVVMAQVGLSVVIVDTDLRRPSQHTIFRLTREDGLTNALLHSNPGPDGYLQNTMVENLRVLTSGPLPPNPSELLGSERMRGLIEQFREQVDMVIFDSPPCLAVTDAAVLSRQVDGVLLVVDAGASRRELAARAVEDLRKVGGNMLGAVLNRVSPRGSGYYYYYYSKDSERTKRHKSKSLTRRLAKRMPVLTRWLG